MHWNVSDINLNVLLSGKLLVVWPEKEESQETLNSIYANSCYSASCPTTHKAELAYVSAFFYLRKICFQPFVCWPKENTLCSVTLSEHLFAWSNMSKSYHCHEFGVELPFGQIKTDRGRGQRASRNVSEICLANVCSLVLLTHNYTQSSRKQQFSTHIFKLVTTEQQFNVLPRALTWSVP